MTKARIHSTILGHVGDGNFHVLMLLSPDDPAEWHASEELNHRIVERALQAGGTCTGEHGVGLHKREFLSQEIGESAVDVMRQIQQGIDTLIIQYPCIIIISPV